jgi:serine/threonine-protein kinase RsbW
MTARLRLAFPSRPEYLVLGRLVLSGLARVQPIEPGHLGDLKLALTEASSNSVRHAYADDGGTVEIIYEVGESHLAIEVRDDGSGFDTVVANPDAEARDEGGLGLAIIQAVCDDTQMGRGPDGSGSWIRFVRHFDEEEG